MYTYTQNDTCYEIGNFSLKVHQTKLYFLVAIRIGLSLKEAVRKVLAHTYLERFLVWNVPQQDRMADPFATATRWKSRRPLGAGTCRGPRSGLANISSRPLCGKEGPCPPHCQVQAPCPLRCPQRCWQLRGALTCHLSEFWTSARNVKEKSEHLITIAKLVTAWSLQASKSFWRLST